MRRRVEPDPISGSLQDGRSHRRCRTFPVRPADVKHRITTMRLPHPGQQDTDRLQSQLDAVLL